MIEINAKPVGTLEYRSSERRSECVAQMKPQELIAHVDGSGTHASESDARVKSPVAGLEAHRSSPTDRTVKGPHVPARPDRRGFYVELRKPV